MSQIENLDKASKVERAFVYVVYGDDIYYKEAAYSILTLRLSTPEIPILVLVERTGDFENIQGVTPILMSEKTRQDWLQGTSYHFELKLRGVKHILENYAKKLIFIDSDTIIERNLVHLFDDIDKAQFLMHKKEGRLGEKKFYRHYKKAIGKQFEVSKEGLIKVTKASPMYNSGVIGVSEESVDLIEKALLLMRQINRLTHWHTAEQLAVGIVLDLNGTIKNVGNANIYHYWHKKPKKYIREKLNAFFLEYTPHNALHLPESVKKIRKHRPFVRWLSDKLGRTMPVTES
ncbi:hypothetical protein CW735_03360 [Alteromonas sp. MB-3u-76]|uniref:hypothetical protein n=1 Tax=Alteromonas sp. MB-3u-76 TaxID=2058133 RepID=UPI000C30805C|nr:hypothetical protein [Alteromonas sp. MB-3u-76]AUC87354.1 hypothetical protein CW735_03360 [Alteromonas sp. MB-3u-76]|tara:strand:+ start:1936 stop:2802 length:867 start_codon:yes stop_codon:yes gene_type:complete